ncbi:unnamed protein product [Cuscuta epithymum]|uniref:Uncharacterized protein n=1 Tax=Cuscuta epithymum TaxID=186058 RepID=A0AAV0DL31_9ASTE|nr:unnamed protein product [Cuscuta epithymum]
MTPPVSPAVKIALVATCSLLAPLVPPVLNDQVLPLVKMNLEFSGDFFHLENALKMKNEISQLLLPSASSAFSGFSHIDILSASSAFAFQVRKDTLFITFVR